MSTLKVLKPSVPTFVSSTVAEPASSDPASAWSATSAYAAGDTVYVLGTEHRTYEATLAHQSLLANTTGTATMTIATPCVVTWGSATQLDGTAVVFSTTGALPTGLTVGTTYYVVGAAANTFNLAATLGGTAINTSGSQSGVHTAIADMCVVVTPGICNGVATMDVSGVSAVKCEMFNGSTLVYTETKTLDNTFISSWYEYFFEPYDVFSDLLFGPLPPYPSATVKLTFTPTSAGSTIHCGAALYGNTVELGTVEYGASAGIEDYSRIETDDFGTTTIVERGFLKHASYSVNVDASQYRRVFSTCAALRATPSVWIASDDVNLSPLNAYGLPTFNTNVPYYGYINCTIEIKGI